MQKVVSTCHNAGLLIASLRSFCLVLLFTLEVCLVLGDVTLVLHFLHLLMMILTVFHGALPYLKIL